MHARVSCRASHAAVGVRNQLCVVAPCMRFNLFATAAAAAGMSVNQSWHRHQASGWTERVQSRVTTHGAVASCVALPPQNQQQETTFGEGLFSE